MSTYCTIPYRVSPQSRRISWQRISPLVPSHPQPVSKHWPLASRPASETGALSRLDRGKTGILANTIRHVISDQGLDLAAGLAFYALLSIAPATLALVSMLGVVGEAKSTAEAVLGLISDLSTEAAQAIRPIVTELVSSPAAGLTLIVSVAVAIWSSSKYVGAFGRAANRAYAVQETRPLWKLKPMMLLITLVTAAPDGRTRDCCSWSQGPSRNLSASLSVWGRWR